MNVTALPQSDTFRTSPIRGLPTEAKIDRKTGVIIGAKAMQIGPLSEADARPWKVDKTTLEQLVDFTNRPNVGTKMRFAHPNMSRDGMGRHIGRARNARIVGTGDDMYVAVDPALSAASKRSPSGNLFDYVFDLVEEAPEDFGLSIAPILDMEAMNKIEPDAKGLRPIRLKGLRAIDFVDEPAATRGGLFSLDSDSVSDLPAQATHVLDTFFGDAPADVIRGRFEEFLTTYLRSRGETMSATDNSAELATIKAENEALTKTNADLAAKLTPPVETPKDPKEAEKAAAKAELSRRSEISALCTLAKVNDADRDLFIGAGFSRAEAQDYLKASGRLSVANPPVTEGGNDADQQKKTPEDKFGAEYDTFAAIYERQGLSREEFIHSRKIDEGLAPVGSKLKAAK